MGTLGKNINDVREFVGSRVDDMRVQVEDRLGDISHRVGSTDLSALTSKIERVTTALPPSAWLTLAGASVVGSLALNLLGKHQSATFIGELAPTFLLVAVYNKLVKLNG